MYVSESTVTAEATSGEASPSIYVSGNITIENSSNVSASSNGMRGIFTDSDITIKDSQAIKPLMSSTISAKIKYNLTVTWAKIKEADGYDIYVQALNGLSKKITVRVR